MKPYKGIKKNLIIFSDFGIDDILALYYLINNPNVNLVGIILSNGVLDRMISSPYASFFIQQFTNEDIPIVLLSNQNSVNINVPLGPRNFTLLTYERISRSFGDKLKKINLMSESSFFEALRKNKIPLHLVVLSPVTDLVFFLRTRNDIIKNIVRIDIMGGALDTEGNIYDGIHNWSEWNFFYDAYSVRELFQLNIKSRLILLDATKYLPCTQGLVDYFHKKIDIKGKCIIDTLLQYIVKEKSYLFDPLAAVVVMEDNIQTIEIKTENLDIICDLGQEYGRLIRKADGFTLDTVSRIDLYEFEELFLRWL
jgi:inosine-uridine nucleoside N-ribohydrolase